MVFPDILFLAVFRPTQTGKWCDRRSHSMGIAALSSHSPMVIAASMTVLDLVVLSLGLLRIFVLLRSVRVSRASAIGFDLVECLALLLKLGSSVSLRS